MLRADHGHPTAIQVYRRVVAHHPNVSQKTVYEVLDALVGVGLARCITEGGGAARYEGRPLRPLRARLSSRRFRLVASELPEQHL
jgi:Fe2+ or Zn2+ uptake regulation protein